MSTKNDLERVFRDVFEDESICLRDDMTAEDIEEWDSLMHINLIIAIEKNFNIRFTTMDVMNLENVGQFVQMLESKLR